MKRIWLTNVILVGVLFIACKKGDPIIIPPPEYPECYFCDTTESKLEVIWQAPLHPDTLNALSIEPVLLEDKVIFTRKPDVGASHSWITAYNKYTGNIVWEIQSPSTVYASYDNSMQVYQEDIIYAAGDREIYRIDGASGSILWEYNPQDAGLWASTRFVIIDGHYYREHNTGGTEPNKTSLIKGDLNTGQPETIFTFQKDNEYGPQILFPSLWESPEGESFLFFKNRQYDFGTVDGFLNDLYMLNLTNNEIEYAWEDFIVGGTTDSWGPYIWENKLYTTGNDSLFCIDIASKEILWKKYIGQYGRTPYFIEKGVLVLNPDDLRIMGIDPNTGIILWQKNKSCATCSTMKYFDGLVYMGSLGTGRLYAIDVVTGEHIWEEKTPNRKNGFPNADFLNGVVIDEANRVLYTDDENFVMAIKLPES